MQIGSCLAGCAASWTVLSSGFCLPSSQVLHLGSKLCLLLLHFSLLTCTMQQKPQPSVLWGKNVFHTSSLSSSFYFKWESKSLRVVCAGEGHSWNNSWLPCWNNIDHFIWGNVSLYRILVSAALFFTGQSASLVFLSSENASKTHNFLFHLFWWFRRNLK